MDNVKVSWSGGKDSTCASLLHLFAGHSVSQVCYIPMLTDTIPLIRKCHYDFILSASDFFSDLGSDVHLVTGETYFDYCLRPAKKGPRKGLPLGFPCFLRHCCGFRRDSKIKAINSVDIPFDYEDIGIAFDEYDRHSQLTDLKRSILVERHITEHDAFLYCFHAGLLSPLYSSFSRDGCAVCPHAKSSEFLLWLEDYPEAKDILLYLESVLKPIYPDRSPYRNHLYFSDLMEIPPLFL